MDSAEGELAEQLDRPEKPAKDPAPETGPPSPGVTRPGVMRVGGAEYYRTLAGRLEKIAGERVVGNQAKVEVRYAAEVLYQLADRLSEGN